MDVRVTKEDINKGIPGLSCSCAIARAIKRHTHKIVNVTETYVTIDGKYYFATNYKQVKQFIRNFDNSATRRFCRPFTIQLKK